MKNKEYPRISIVFVTWNGKKYTFDLIESLKKIIYPNYDIIVVDNGSTDGTQKEFKDKYNKLATLIENKKNLGLAEGTNVGIREALKRKSKYVLIMNNDMYVNKDFLNPLVESMEKHPKVAVGGPKIYYMEPKNIIWCAGCDYQIKGFKPRNQREVDIGQADKERYVDGIDCVLILRSDILKKIGLLDSKLFFIHELTEWSLRAKKEGYKSIYIPESKVWHKVSAAFEKNKKESEIQTYYNIRNWLLVVRKNKSLAYFILVLFLEATFLFGIRLLKYIKRRQFGLVKTYFIAIWHALVNKTPMELYPYKD